MTPLEIAVVGATGAVGEQLLTALSRSTLPIGVVRVYGSANRSRSVDEVSYGSENLPVEAITSFDPSSADVVILCAPGPVGARLASGLKGRGPLVIDLGNSSAGVEDAPLVHPTLTTELPAEVDGLVRTPSSVGWLLSLVVAPLIDAGLTGVSGTVMLPATSRGRSAMEELGQQVVASLTSQDPPRRIFPDGLAFDVIAEDTPAEEWSVPERLAAEEVASLTGLAPERIAVSLGTFPWFAGMVASLHLRGVDYDAAENALNDAPGLKGLSTSAKLRPRAVAGRDVVAWGRLRADPGGDGVHVWVVADNLVGAGAGAGLAVLQLAVEAGKLPRRSG